MADFKRFLKVNNLKQEDAARYFDVTQGFISQIVNNHRPVPPAFISKIKNDANIIASELIDDSNRAVVSGDKSDRHLIPFYDDVATIGGTEITADVETAHTYATEFIDAGDWFRDASAAIRHYGISMVEYPSGCILALREVRDRQLIIPGRDYTIETSEYRVTKRLQKGKTHEYVTAYSTNLETYPDGRMIHEPFDIPWSSIRRIYAVLGYVVKKNGGTFVFSNNKK